MKRFLLAFSRPNNQDRPLCIPYNTYQEILDDINKNNWTTDKQEMYIFECKKKVINTLIVVDIDIAESS